MSRENLANAEKLEKKLQSMHESAERLTVGSLSANLNVLISRVRKVSSSLIRDYNELENLQTTTKSHDKFIKSARDNCEKKLQMELSKARPGYGFLFKGKPEIVGEDTSHRFICDVLNGDDNFARTIPFFCISVAIEENKEIINSVIYNPITDELFYGEKGNGSFMICGRGNRKLRVSGKNDLKTLLLSNIKDDLHDGDIRRLGSPALTLAYVAAGKLDGTWETSVTPCDIAAGVLLVKEAAGVVKSIGSSSKKDKDIVYSEKVFAGNEAVAGFFNKIV